MAKRRSHGKRRRHRSRRIGAMALNPSQPIIKLAAVGLGYFLGDTINGAIDKVVPDSMKLTPPAGVGQDATLKYVPGVAAVGLGGLLLLSKRRASLIKTGVGGVLAGAGLKRLLKQSGVISGYQAVPVIGTARRHRMAGYQSTPVIGVTTPPQLAGNVPAQLQGYRVNGYTPHGSGMGVLGALNGVDPRGANTTGSGVTYGSSSGYMG